MHTPALDQWGKGGGGRKEEGGRREEGGGRREGGGGRREANDRHRTRKRSRHREDKDIEWEPQTCKGWKAVVGPNVEMPGRIKRGPKRPPSMEEQVNRNRTSPSAGWRAVCRTERARTHTHTHTHTHRVPKRQAENELITHAR